MEIVKGLPPNYERIVAVLPAARRSTVIFSYGDRLFVPSGKGPNKHLLVHEAVHGLRQKELGIEFWWEKYLESETFRFFEELQAHRAEYLSMVREGMNRNQRRGALKSIAERLASPLYGSQRSWKTCAKAISKGISV